MNNNLDELKLVFENSLYNTYKIVINKSYSIKDLIDNFILDAVIYLEKESKNTITTQLATTINDYAFIVTYSALDEAYISIEIKHKVFIGINDISIAEYHIDHIKNYRDKEKIKDLVNNKINVVQFYYELIKAIIFFTTIKQKDIKTKYILTINIDTKFNKIFLISDYLYTDIKTDDIEIKMIKNGFAEIKTQNNNAIIPILYENGKAITLDIEIAQNYCKDNLSYGTNGNFSIYRCYGKIIFIDVIEYCNNGSFFHNVIFDNNGSFYLLKLYYNYDHNEWVDINSDLGIKYSGKVL